MIRTIIIDDELHAIRLIQSLAKKHCPDLKIIAYTTDPVNGLRKISKLKPDLLFLDVHMPLMSGFELLETINDRSFDVIFTTAFDNYALKAFKVSAIDYLLKPVNAIEFVNAVNKVTGKNPENQLNNKYDELVNYIKNTNQNKLAIPTNDGFVYIKKDDIVRIKGDGNYSSIYTSEKKRITASKTIKTFEERLQSNNFLRVHKSHLININYVCRYSGKDGGIIEMEDGEQVHISRRKKDEFIQKMELLIE